MQTNEPHPDNVTGDFYVECDSCIACEAPYNEAPDLMARPYTSERDHGCYFRRNPTTHDEIERACMAVSVSCVKAVRYRGNNPAILNYLYHQGAITSCDVAYKRQSIYERSAFEAYSQHVGPYDQDYWSHICTNETDHVVVSIGNDRDVLAVYRIDKSTQLAVLVENSAKYWPDIGRTFHP
ncbi:MAG TPA: hypothetical protein DD473_17800 [Planctomycetaceae bacterium]|nr:hypothetical protein [Planctomycetaceae bacterium]